MSSRLTQVLLALSLLLNCFVLAGFVWRTWIEPPALHRAGGPPPGPRGMSPLEAPPERRALEARFAHGWFSTITEETFG